MLAFSVGNSVGAGSGFASALRRRMLKEGFRTTVSSTLSPGQSLYHLQGGGGFWVLLFSEELSKQYLGVSTDI